MNGIVFGIWLLKYEVYIEMYIKSFIAVALVDVISTVKFIVIELYIICKY